MLPKVSSSTVIRTVVALALAHAWSPSLAAPATHALSGSRPNVVVFIADDAGMDFGAYGNRVVRTPNIDRLAREGLVFSRAFLTSPQCSPSRTSMLSGQYAHTVGTEDLHVPLPEGKSILPKHLREQAGYFTGRMLKGHIGKPAEEQFDWSDNGFYPEYVEGRWNARALSHFQDFLDAAGRKPFFLWTAFVDPHRPYQDEKNGAPRVHDPGRIKVPPHLVNDRATKADIAAYYDELARMDNHIGQMLGELEKRSLRQDTLIVFLSDNGAPFPGGKGTLYDAGVQTPFIVSWPAKLGTGRREALVSTIDLAPTMLELAGVSSPTPLSGASLLPLLTDATLPGRDFVFAERNWHNADEHMRMVRSPSHKLIVNAYTERPFGNPSDVATSPSWRALLNAQRAGRLTPLQARLFAAPRPSVELYDLARDPGETRNLAFDPTQQETLASLSKALEAWMKSSEDFPPTERQRPDDTDRITGARLPKLWGKGAPSGGH